MRDRPRNSAPRLEWPGGIVPEWAKPQGNPNKRRRGGKGKGGGGGHGGHERQGGSSPGKRERLQKVMAQSGHGSRRNIEILIAQGHITINGQVAKLGDLVGPGDKVKMDGEFINLRFGDPLPRVLLYHKPEGEIVSRDDPGGRSTVFENLPKVHNGRWVSIGRLDINTGGLLIFTTSGELANRMMHPRFEVEREYAVRLMGELTEETQKKLLEGVDIDGDKAKFDLIEDRGGSEEGSNHWYHVVLKEGKNREVRKMFEAVGLMVSRLLRVRFGAVAMPTFLKRGMTKELEEQEVAKLLELAGISTGLTSAPPVDGPAPAATADAPASAEIDDDLQPPGLSHEYGLRPPGGGRGPRPQGNPQNPQQKFGRQGKNRNKPRKPGGGGQPGQHAQGQPGQGHGQPGQGHGQGQGQGQARGGGGRKQWQGKHKHGKGGQGQGGGGNDNRGNVAPRENGGNAANDNRGNQAHAPRGNQRHRQRGDEQPRYNAPKQQQRGDEQPRFNTPKQQQRGDEQPRFNSPKQQQRGDEQPRFNEPQQENQRGDEQPTSNENRRIW